ncbi:hypothetical protein ACFWOJ_16215 [Streptomyces sp. NPDC058439]|uniref:hypothetical protein n=1 Tax=Streptomyces sp. NPDC058439 TaxID=3346500 RepID=UPI003657D535
MSGSAGIIGWICRRRVGVDPGARGVAEHGGEGAALPGALEAEEAAAPHERAGAGRSAQHTPGMDDERLRAVMPTAHDDEQELGL